MAGTNVGTIYAGIELDNRGYVKALNQSKSDMAKAAVAMQKSSRVKVDVEQWKKLTGQMNALKGRAQETRLALLKAAAGSDEAKLQSELSGIEKRLRLVKAAAEPASKELARMAKSGEKAFAGMSERMTKFGKSMSMYVTAPLIGMATMSVKFGMDYEKAMRNVNAISRLSDDEFQQLGTSVKRLAVEIGKAPEDLAKGLYDIASSGFQGREGVEVLRHAVIGAKAGLSDTATAAKALTAVLNAYGLAATDSSRIMDIMFKIVENGVITFEEMALNIGGVISTAAAGGISFEELGAAVATLTKAGNPAAESITALNNLIRQIISPSKEAMDTADELGLAWLAAGKGAEVLKNQGLGRVMAEIGKATGGSLEQMAKMFPELRAMKGALGLVRQEGSAFAEDLRAMGDASGSAAAALAEQEKSFAATWEKMVASLKVAAISIGDSLIPMLKSAAKWITRMTDAWQKLGPGVKGFVTAALGVIAIVGPLIWGIGQIIKAVQILRTAWATMSAIIAASTKNWAMLGSIAAGTAAAVLAMKALTKAEAKMWEKPAGITEAPSAAAAIGAVSDGESLSADYMAKEFKSPIPYIERRGPSLDEIVNPVLDKYREMKKGQADALNEMLNRQREWAGKMVDSARQFGAETVDAVRDQFNKEQEVRDQAADDAKSRYEKLSQIGRIGAMAMTKIVMFGKKPTVEMTAADLTPERIRTGAEAVAASRASSAAMSDIVNKQLYGNSIGQYEAVSKQQTAEASKGSGALQVTYLAKLVEMTQKQLQEIMKLNRVQAKT